MKITFFGVNILIKVWRSPDWAPSHDDTHSIERIQERYGLELSRGDLRQLEQKIQGGRARKIRKISKTRSEYELLYQGQRIHCIYSHKGRKIVTFLPNRKFRLGDMIAHEKLMELKNDQ
jgi:hypothetical protein